MYSQFEYSSYHSLNQFVSHFVKLVKTVKNIQIAPRLPIIPFFRCTNPAQEMDYGIARHAGPFKCQLEF